MGGTVRTHARLAKVHLILLLVLRSSEVHFADTCQKPLTPPATTYSSLCGWQGDSVLRTRERRDAIKHDEDDAEARAKFA